MHLIFENILLSGNRFTIEFRSADSPSGSSSPSRYHLLSLGSFNYGFNETKDTIFYPENVSIEFSIARSSIPSGAQSPSSLSAFQQEYFRIINTLTFTPVTVTIWRGDRIFFLGSVDPKSVTSSYDNLSVRCTVLSDFLKLKSINPRTDSLGLPLNTDEKIRFQDLILWIIYAVLPQVDYISQRSELLVETGYTFLEEPVYADFDDLGAFIFDYIGSPWAHEDYISVLKDVLSTFGLVMFIYDNAVILRPRWYFPSEPFIITDKITVSGPDASGHNALALKGLCVKINRENYTFSQSYSLGAVEFDESGSVKNGNEVETVYISQVGGAPPGVPDTQINQRNFWVWLPEYITGINNSDWVPSIPSGCFWQSRPEVKSSLWKLLGDRLWELISNERLSFKIELLGTDYIFNPFFVHHAYPETKFRIRTASVDFTRGTTTLELLEC